MTSAFRLVWGGGLAVGLVLAMFVAGGVASADPDSGASSPSAPSADASPPGSPADPAAGPSSSDSTTPGSSGSSPDTAQRPASKVGSEPTAGVSSSGGAQSSSDGVSAAEDELAKDTTDLAATATLIEQQTQAVQAKLDAIKGQGGSVNSADMFQVQMLMNRLTQLSEMSTAIVSASNTATLSMARGVK